MPQISRNGLGRVENLTLGQGLPLSTIPDNVPGPCICVCSHPNSSSRQRLTHSSPIYYISPSLFHFLFPSHRILLSLVKWFRVIYSLNRLFPFLSFCSLRGFRRLNRLIGLASAGRRILGRRCSLWVSLFDCLEPPKGLHLSAYLLIVHLVYLDPKSFLRTLNYSRSRLTIPSCL